MGRAGGWMTKHAKRSSILSALRPARLESAERRLPARGELALALGLGGPSIIGAFILVGTAPPIGGNDGALGVLVVALVLLSLLALCDVWTVATLTTGVRLRLSSWTLIVAFASVIAARLTLAPGVAAVAGTLRHEGDRSIVPQDIGPTVLVLTGLLRPDSKGAIEVEIRAGDRRVAASLARRHARGPLGLRQVQITVAEATTFIALPRLAQGRSIELGRLSGPLDGAIGVRVFERVLPLWMVIGASSALLILTGVLAGRARLILFTSALAISLSTAAAALSLPPGSGMGSALGPLLIGLPIGMLVGPASPLLSGRLRRWLGGADDERRPHHGGPRRASGRVREAPER